MATVDELVVRIKADASQLERELRRVNGTVQQQTRGMSTAFGGLKRELAALAPALGAVAIVGFGKQAVDAAGRMKDLGDRIGFAASTLSALEGGLAGSGASLEEFASAVNLMNANIGQAVSGNEQLAGMFSRLGLSLEELKKLTPEQQFYLIADALSRVGTQYEQTEIARAVFGRGAAALIPIINESNGALDEYVQKLKDTESALSQETIDRIDAFGDAMAQAAKDARNEFLELFAGLLRVIDKIDEFRNKYGPTAAEINKARLANYGITDTGPRTTAEDAYLAKAKAGGFATEVTRGTVSPAASNTPAATATRQAAAVKQVTYAERERNRIIETNKTAYERFMEGSTRANALFADDAEQRNRELQRLWQEYADTGTTAMDEVKDSAIATTRVIKDYIGDALESALFDFENFGDAAGGILEGIARQIARTQLINPISEGLTGLIESSGITSGLGDIFGGFFADGGRPPVGKASVVGERGPELFVPDSAGTVIPNGGMGGGNSITVQHIWQIQSGVTRQELASLIPVIEERATAKTLAAVERGGRAAQIVGRRN